MATTLTAIPAKPPTMKMLYPAMVADSFFMHRAAHVPGWYFSFCVAPAGLYPSTRSHTYASWTAPTFATPAKKMTIDTANAPKAAWMFTAEVHAVCI